ncbi:MAG TPA: SDR family oxidoreductase [Burkholderiaceae bacterium]|jgi:NAD(P)-dependent dehydrogenase (short-subunit alcohol dehydrogenase family)|nr:SDR family oxidoreductase [Burkholderiaceae bacterium]
MKSFKDKVAVVTGAGSGIGRHLSLQLTQAGTRVAMSDVNELGLAETLKMMPPGANAKCYRVDVSSKEQVFAHAEDVKRDFGTAHYIFNNAGVTLAGTIAQVTIEEIEWQLGINLWGVIYGTKAFLPMLLAQREGHIVNISSLFGLVACATQGPYNVSKFGVRGWTECLWQELEGTGVSATSVHPGGIKTEIAHMARMSVNADQTVVNNMKSADKSLLTPAADMARAILDGVARDKKRIIYGHGAKMLNWFQRLMPVYYGTLMARARERR